MKPGDRLSLRIEKPAAGGWMIARADRQVILVSGAVPGEQATVEIDRVGQGVAYARVIAVEESSVDRRVPFVDPTCGGSLYAHINYPRQLEIKSQVITDALTRIGHLDWPEPIGVAASPDEGYRMRSRLHIRRGRLGFLKEATHDLCDVRATRQLLPESCDVLEQIAGGLESQSDLNGELEVSENVAAGDRVVHLEHRTPVSVGRWADITAGLRLTGVTMAPHSERVVRAVIVAGDPHVTDDMSFEGHNVRLRRHVQAFFQGNRFLLHSLIGCVLSQVAASDDVVDLYAGAGLFSIPAAIVRGAHVTAVEGDRFAAADLSSNAQAASGSVEAVHQSVEVFSAGRRRSPAVLIVDPPRTGMSKDALTGAIQLKPRKVVYVSCDVATLARDTRRLVDAGYALSSVTGFDLFPNTPHVETVVVLRSSH
jgi:23S rRNA (uracil1939-C5)-methyltransferase